MLPAEEYTRRRDERQVRARELDRLHYHLANARLIGVGLILVVGWLVLEHQVTEPIWLLLPVVVLAVAVVWHGRVEERWNHARRAVAFYEDGLHRLDDTWMGRGLTGEEYLQDSHPYAKDLDVFGHSSLFDLLCIARTRLGEDRLAAWLTTPAAPEAIPRRRQMVEELKPRLDLREDLAALYEGRSELKGNTLVQWGCEPVRLTSVPMRLVALVLGICGVAALVWWLITWNPVALVVVLAIQQLFMRGPQADVNAVMDGVEPIRRDGLRLAAYLKRLEPEKVLPVEGAADALYALDRLILLLDARRNLFVSPLVYLSLWTFQMACEIERWRQRYGPQLGPWMEALADFEALNCFASLAYERPSYVWPELQGSGIDARGLAHPLLGAGAIPNDVTLSDIDLWVVSGSNMSGKSSLLRTLGTNVVLAMAGAPVRAVSLRMEPLRVGASLQLADSLAGGVSRFYAEILRLRSTVEMAAGTPRLLFLLDEIMAGTNSHDRLIGAQAVIRTLLARGALGLVTTHDLALTEMVNQLPRASNVHFEDQIIEGKVTFDYHVRSGVVTHSNALALMRAIGLEV
ncbi:MAG: MutS-related protein [Candidatus Xenobia bacterium]